MRKCWHVPVCITLREAELLENIRATAWSPLEGCSYKVTR